jgi:hypothetical protein
LRLADAWNAAARNASSSSTLSKAQQTQLVSGPPELEWVTFESVKPPKLTHISKLLDKDDDQPFLPTAPTATDDHFGHFDYEDEIPNEEE